jgi:hypothetical protein
MALYPNEDKAAAKLLYHIVTRNRCDMKAHTAHPKGKQNHSDIPKKIRKNTLTTNSVIANSFCNCSITANSG